MAVTIKDIVAATDLSLATVSKYLNHKRVSKENAEKIQRAIDTLGFRVNPFARSLKTHKSATIAILTSSLTYPFDANIIARMEDVFRRNHYGTLVCDYRSNAMLEGEILDFILSKNVEGVVCFMADGDGRALAPLQERGIPIVSVGSLLEHVKNDAVMVDDYGGGYNATRYLIRKGYTDIAVIAGYDTTRMSLERYRGFADAMTEAGLPIRQEYVAKGDWSFEGGSERMKVLLRLTRPPQAVFLTNYFVTIGAILAMHSLGKRYPEDVGVVAFDKFDLVDILEPRLTVAHPPMDTLAQAAADILLERLSGAHTSPETQVIRVPAELFIGKSTRC